MMTLKCIFRFRVDDKFVVDATMDGGRARFINHSCGPNCMSKIITVDGRKVSFFYFNFCHVFVPKSRSKRMESSVEIKMQSKTQF